MEALDDAIARALGSRPVRYTARAGGYSTADRYAVELADGRSVFVKSSDVSLLAGWIRREREVYTAVRRRALSYVETAIPVCFVLLYLAILAAVIAAGLI